ncbi:MAG TPA: tripartite tricarboxylate transporter TctB family protein [Pseudolabrys sp.]|nr:tripartite tricarboxylate transporter TctB family protein [Pseudolabrys sp.]
MMLSRDGISGLVCLAISVILLTQTFGLPPAAIVPIGPAFYPRVVLLIVMLLSVILIVLDVRAMRTARAAAAPAPSEAFSPNYRLVLATFIEFGLYILLLPPLGFRIATFLFVLSLQVTLEWPRSSKHWLLAIAVAAATSLICYLVFQNYLSLLLPRGTWSNM